MPRMVDLPHQARKLPGGTPRAPAILFGWALLQSRSIQWVLGVSVLGCAIYRAATQSVTYDEAFTYNWLLDGPVDFVFTRYTANNHVLFSLLASLSLKIFGLSPLALRLPTLLGAALFLFASAGLASVAFDRGGSRLAVFAALTLNPFVLDFCVAARGYGLALGLFAVALYLSTRVVAAGVHDKRVYAAIAVGLGLAIASNLTMLFPAIAVALTLAVICVLSAREGDRTAETLKLMTWLALPGVLVPSALLFRPLLEAKREHFFFGASSLFETAQSLVEASLRHHPSRWNDTSVVVSSASFIARIGVPMGVLFICAALMLGTYQMGKSHFRNPLDRMVVLVSGAFVLCLLILVVAHTLASVPYPLDRTGLSLIFLFTLSLAIVMSAVGHYSGMHLLADRSVKVALGVLALCYFTEANVSHFREWRFDAGTKDLFQRVVQYQPPFGHPIRLATSYVYEPSLNFYRALYETNDVALVTGNWVPGFVDFDFLILHSQDAFSPSVLAVAAPVYVHRLSGAVLLKKKALVPANRGEPKQGT